MPGCKRVIRRLVVGYGITYIDTSEDLVGQHVGWFSNEAHLRGKSVCCNISRSVTHIWHLCAVETVQT